MNKNTSFIPLFVFVSVFFSLQATAASSLNKVKTKKIYRGDVTVLGEEKPTFYYDRIKKESKSES